MKDRIKTIINRHEELSKLLSDPSVMNDQNKYKVTAQEHSQLSPIVLKRARISRCSSSNCG